MRGGERDRERDVGDGLRNTWSNERWVHFGP